VLATVHLAPTTFLAIVGTSAVAGTLATLAGGRGVIVPVVVVERDGRTSTQARLQGSRGVPNGRMMATRPISGHESGGV